MTESRTPGSGDPLGIFSKGLSDDDFVRLSRLVYDYCGIKLPPHKKSMLEARLRRRLRVHGMRSFEEYCDFVFSHSGMEQEFVSLIDVVTTNKTDFFREPAHFNFLTERALPALIEQCGAGIDRTLQVWSAGCASGEEPYTLAMVLSEFARQTPGFRFSILGTDISTRVLEHARLGIYAADKVAPVPESLKKRYLLRSRESEKPQVRIVPELRSLVAFQHLNFMEDRFDGPGAVDILFCRNVIIYFDRPTQQAMLERLCSHLAPGRFIFMGHSETLHGMNLPLVQVSPSVYRRK
jgi:chemotaxis protein methyltransferase CheR